jgi:hypothetical protein
MLSDVVMDKTGGALTKNVNANGIKTAENQLDRAQRVQLVTQQVAVGSRS